MEITLNWYGTATRLIMPYVMFVPSLYYLIQMILSFAGVAGIKNKVFQGIRIITIVVQMMCFYTDYLRKKSTAFSICRALAIRYSIFMMKSALVSLLY